MLGSHALNEAPSCCSQPFLSPFHGHLRRQACARLPRPRSRLTRRAASIEEVEEGYEEGVMTMGYEEGSLVQHFGMPPASRPTQQLSPQEVIDALYAGVHDNAQNNYLAFFSSELGGIVTDPALMVVSMDDHIVHRGHAVFDTASLTQGYLYQLDDHLDRFYRSAGKAGLTPPYERERLRRIILDTAAASRSFDGHVRYWLGAGRGGFGISPLECLHTSFYCMVYKTANAPDSRRSGEPLVGWTVKTSPVPIKDPYFATVKSTNYLPNALAALDAQLEGYDQGVFVDSEGYIAEGPVMNIGIITHEGEMAVPPFDQTLDGITLQRLLQLLKEFKPDKQRDVLQFIKMVSQRPIKLEEAKRAKEVFMVGSATVVMPVIRWDDTEFLQTKPDPEVGILALSLRALLEEDMDPTNNRGQHVEVPYGMLTDMVED